MQRCKFLLLIQGQLAILIIFHSTGSAIVVVNHIVLISKMPTELILSPYIFVKQIFNSIFRHISMSQRAKPEYHWFNKKKYFYIEFSVPGSIIFFFLNLKRIGFKDFDKVHLIILLFIHFRVP